jgi:hypothetical protein
MTGRFRLGDHLQVQRRWLYFHHGIYISDDRVIQFGSGVRLWDKARTAISAVTLAEFEQDGTAEVARHGYESWLTGHHPAADDGWKVAARAEFLLKLQPHLRYNLMGHNCEIIANMCASGSWSESYQTRRFFTVRTAMDIPLMFYIAIRSRRRLPLPGWVAPVVLLGVAASVAVKTTYDDQIRRLWKEIRGDWLENERLLAEDPRNGQIT